MAEYSPEKQPWPIQVADAIAKLTGVARITWSHQGIWRQQHVVALKDLSLPSTKKAFSLVKDQQVYVEIHSHPGPEYKLADGTTVPAANIRLELESDGITLRKEKQSPTAAPKALFYVGTVVTSYQYHPPAPVMIPKGGMAYLPTYQDIPGSEYEVRNASDGTFEATVPADAVEVRGPGQSIPDHDSAPIELLCFELFPYAAVHAKLMSSSCFFRGIANRGESSGLDGSIAWARFLGADLPNAPAIEDLKQAKFGRGDIIVLYNGPGSAIHTVIASGDTHTTEGPMVYSLSEDPDPHPGHWPLTTVAATFTGNNAVAYVKSFTPASPT
jgi:hypothetical protein